MSPRHGQGRVMAADFDSRYARDKMMPMAARFSRRAMPHIAAQASQPAFRRRASSMLHYIECARARDTPTRNGRRILYCR